MPNLEFVTRITGDGQVVGSLQKIDDGLKKGGQSARIERERVIRIVARKEVPRLHDPQSNEDRIRFIIDFAQVDLESLRDGDRSNLWEDFCLFLGMRKNLEDGDEYTFNRKTVDGILVELTEEFVSDGFDFKPRQKKILELLLTIIRSNWGNPVQIRYSFQYLATDPPTKCIQGTFNDVTLLFVDQLLGKVGLDRIKVCKCCSRIFYQEHKKMRYCSRQCGNKTYMRSYRASDKGKETKSESNHRSYEKRVKKQLGGRVKVERRQK